MAARTVTVIPAKPNITLNYPERTYFKRRVAGYARVSTDSDEQFTSYEAQIDYYTQYIKRNPEWEFVGVYTDEGISGTNTKKRNGFNKMVEDALSGKIDLIVTKSVSRFARNTVDSLITVRKLKEKGVEVYFEKENIYTLDSKGELMITIMSSLAQEESRSISENVTWGQRKRFSDGKVSLPYSSFLGYTKGDDGLPKVVPEEAEIIKRIYGMFMEGKTAHLIARQLTTEGISSPRGKREWRSSTVTSILTNEKYKGSAILQKEFTVDFLTKKKKVNEGEVPQYYIEHSHEAIIEPIEWEMVQQEIRRRKAYGNKYTGKSIFGTKVVCGDCGGYYGSKVWHSNSKYRKTVLQCNGKFTGESVCKTPHLTEDELKQRFIEAYNSCFVADNQVIENYELIHKLLCDYSKIDEELAECYTEYELIARSIKELVDENSFNIQNQDGYIQRYNSLVARGERIQKKIKILEGEKLKKQDNNSKFELFFKAFVKNGLLLNAFDEKLWNLAVEKVVVNNNGQLQFHFLGGIIVDN